MIIPQFILQLGRRCNFMKVICVFGLLIILETNFVNSAANAKVALAMIQFMVQLVKINVSTKVKSVTWTTESVL